MVVLCGFRKKIRYTSKPVVWADSQIIILSLWSTDINKDESLGGDMTENATLIEKIQHVE
jgi:hypothetical protein